MAQRGTYMDIHEIPGEIVKDADRLADAVRRAAGDDGPGLCTGESKVDGGALESGNGGQTAGWIGSQAKKRDAFLKRYLSACDGQSTARIAEKIRAHCFGEDRETSGPVDA